MWVVFSTSWYGNQDYFSTRDTEAEVKEMYERITKQNDTRCAGYGPISQGTEPHWIDSETNANTPIKEKELKRK